MGWQHARGMTMKENDTEVETGREREIIPLRLTRRRFLKSSGAVAAVAGAGVLAACSTTYHEPPISPGFTPVPEDQQYPEVPPSPAEPAEQNDSLRFFSAQEAKTLDALTGRIIPGDPTDPGAHEAGVLYFIDNALATSPSGDGWNEPHYRPGPFAKPYKGSTPPGPDTSGTVYVSMSELPRYRYQSKLNPQ
jgi:gluconate 2-dehydrogenase gamma chain